MNFESIWKNIKSLNFIYSHGHINLEKISRLYSRISVSKSVDFPSWCGHDCIIVHIGRYFHKSLSSIFFLSFFRKQLYHVQCWRELVVYISSASFFERSKLCDWKCFEVIIKGCNITQKILQIGLNLNVKSVLFLYYLAHSIFTSTVSYNISYPWPK